MNRALPIFLGVLLTVHSASAQRIVYRVPAQYPTIQSAINAVPRGGSQTYRIKIAPGTYREVLEIGAHKAHIVLGGTTTPDQVAVYSPDVDTHALTILGHDITVRNMSLQNTAPPADDDGVSTGALNVVGRRISFVNVNLSGYQDTIVTADGSLANFAHCEITGVIDFICGGGTAYFDACTLRYGADPSSPEESGGISAAANTPPDQKYGLVFADCAITRVAGVPPTAKLRTPYACLCRPWGWYGFTAYIHCAMDAHITPEAWTEFTGNLGHEDTYRCYEYDSLTLAGEPINLAERPAWVARPTDDQVATFFSQHEVLGGWVP